MRLGFTPFPISTRNSVVAIVHLIKSTGTRHLVVSQDAPLQSTADMVCRQFWEADNKLITTIPMPHFGDLFSGKPGSYERLPPVRPDWSQTALIIHSSGSTRFPSPVYTTHKNVLRSAERPCKSSPVLVWPDLKVSQTTGKWTCAAKSLEDRQYRCIVSIPLSMFSDGGMLKSCVDTMGFFSISFSVRPSSTILSLLIHLSDRGWCHCRFLPAGRATFDPNR